MDLPLVVQTYLDAYNRRDAKALIDCVSTDIIFENVSNSGQSIKIEGYEAFSHLAYQSAAVFLDRQQTVRAAVGNGNDVALEIDWTGTHSLDLGPMKAGVRVNMRGASFLTVTSGKLSRIVDVS